MGASGVEITQLLERWKSGDDSVERELATRIYPVLRDLARGQLRRNSSVLTLRATEMANEAYVRLCKQQGVDWQNRDHFFAIAATVMRRVVVDYLRQRGSEKRGGGTLFVNIEDLAQDETPFHQDAVDWLEVDQAMTELAVADPKCARVVELKLFSGLSMEQIAEVCESSTATVGRQWRFARSWLAERMDAGAPGVA